MKYLEILRARLAELAAEREAAVAEMEAATATATEESRSALSAEEQAAFDAARAKVAALDGDDDNPGEIRKVEAQIADLEAIDARAKAAAKAPTAPTVIVKPDTVDVLNDRNAKPAELADAVTRSLEARVDDGENMAHVRKVLARHLVDDLDEERRYEARAWARNLLGRSQPAYLKAFGHYLRGGMDAVALLDGETRAAFAIGTNTQGGFLLPTHLDPTIILTSAGSANNIRQIARVVTLVNGKTWNGISSAGVTASFDGELVEVSDDTPSIANPQVHVHAAKSFVQASIEATEDLAGLSSDVLMMFADARDVLEGAKYATGSGSGEPFGIFTALDANTNVEITSTTAATIGEVDLHSVYRQTPQRFRRRGTWVMNPLYALAVKRLGTAVSSAYSGDLTVAEPDAILMRPVVVSDDAPSTQTTTALDNEIVYGDFSNFVVVDKPGGMSVEYIPHLFNTANNLPDGRRGWYAHWRTGSDSVNDVAFRLLQDKTSA